MGTRSLAIATACTLLFTGTAAADSPRIDRGIVQEGLDEIVRTAAQGVQLRVTDGRTRFTARSGTAGLRDPRPVPANGRFRAGSTTKSFTSAVVLQLAGEGEVDLDAPVTRHLPGLVDDRITVRQLLQHTSGLFNYTDALDFDPPGFEPIRYRHWEPEELVALATSRPLESEPGTRWRYSNTGYVVLGLLIEKITGQDYAEAVSQRVLRPLRLVDTTFPGDSPDIHGPHARSYGLVDGRPTDTTRWNTTVFWAAGDVVSTTKDLDTFYNALLGGVLLAPEQQRELTRTTAVSPGYGLGLFLDQVSCGATIIGHTGSVPGFSSYAYSSPDRKVRAEFSATTGLGTGDPTGAYFRVLDEIFC